jgi:hypothetical protein
VSLAIGYVPCTMSPRMVRPIELMDNVSRLMLSSAKESELLDFPTGILKFHKCRSCRGGLDEVNENVKIIWVST